MHTPSAFTVKFAVSGNSLVFCEIWTSIGTNCVVGGKCSDDMPTGNVRWYNASSDDEECNAQISFDEDVFTLSWKSKKGLSTYYVNSFRFT